jgi:DNA polymerase V
MNSIFPSHPPTTVVLPVLEAWVLPGFVQAGFPSPAEDLGAKRIDVLERLVKHPQATYQMTVRGESMRDAGIFDGDIILIDRAVRPRNGHYVVAVVDGEFVCKKFWQRAGQVKLKAANPTFADIVAKEGQVIEVWGVIITSFKIFPV